MVNITASVEHTELFFSIDVPEDLTLDDFRAMLSAESGVDPENQVLVLNGAELTGDGTQTIEQIGITNDELVVIRNRKTIQGTQQQQHTTQTPQGRIANADERIEQIRQSMLTNPDATRELMQMNPQIEQYLHDPVQFKQFFESAMAQSGMLGGGASHLPGGVSPEEWNRLQQDPDNPDSQKRIMELIEQDQIDENMHAALEMTPESFASVTMLYINVEVNGYPVKAFVDSGAQTTIMSTRLAEKCNLTRLIDKRFRGEARGVGKTTILGKIHSTQLKIEDRFIPCSFTVFDTHVDMLLGLDMLKRHQACIDLRNNKLIIEGIETAFLPESEVPKDEIISGQPLGTPGTAQPIPSSQTTHASPSTSAAAAAGAAAASRRQQTQNVAVDETTVQNLMALGFSRQEVIKALEMAGGNAEVAASLLFQ